MIAQRAGKTEYVSTDYAVGTNLGAFFPGQNIWAAVGDPANKDWIEIGSIFHYPGKSQVKDEGNYPNWGDVDNVFLLLKYAMKIGGFNDAGNCECLSQDNKLSS